MIGDTSLSFEEFQKIHEATTALLKERPKSHAFFDYVKRAQLANKAYSKWRKGEKITRDEKKGYLTNAILPHHAHTLTKDEFQALEIIYGDGLVKLAIIDDTLAQYIRNNRSNPSILGTGGACALETVDTKILDILEAKNEKKHIAKYIEDIFLCFPTWTQVTGSLLPTKGLNVLYDETFPWYLKIEEYGVANPRLVTQRAYDEIFVAVERYVKLHDHNSTLVRIPFIDLDLVKNGKLQEWFEKNHPYIEELEKQYGLDSQEFDVTQHIKSWIEYTYSGPSILELDKKLIQKKYPLEYKKYNVEKSELHVRGKQIDHLDVERPNSWIHDIVLNAVEEKDRNNIERLLSSRVRRSSLSLYMSMRDSYHRSSNGFAGFLDFSYRGAIMHEDIKTLGIRKNMSLEELHHCSVNNPLRLHSKNITSVISFLERFKNPNSISLSKEMLERFSTLKQKSERVGHKINALEQYVNAYKCVLGIENTHKRSFLCIDMLVNRYERNVEVRTSALFPSRNLHVIRKELRTLFELLHMGTDVVNKDTRGKLTFLRQILQYHLANDIQRQEQLKKKQTKFDKELNQIYQAVSDNITHIHSDALTKHVSILPLIDNIFVSYMQQLLFIPSVRLAYLDLISCELDSKLDRTQKEQCIVNVIQRIFPVVEGSIRYVLEGGDYPWELRYKYHYERLY